MSEHTSHRKSLTMTHEDTVLQNGELKAECNRLANEMRTLVIENLELKAELAQAREQALEEAAKECLGFDDDGGRIVALALADRIRDLKSK